MSAINQIVTVTSRVDAASPTVRTFGTPLIVSRGAPYAGGRLYENSTAGRAQMVADGWSTSSVAYRKALTLALQSPGCRDFVAYGRTDNAGGTLGGRTYLLEPHGVFKANSDVEFSVGFNGTKTEVSHTVVTQQGDAVQAVAENATMVAGTVLNYNIGPNEITRTTGSWIDDGFVNGMQLEITGSSTNDGTYSVTGVTATTIEVAELLDEVSNEAPTSVVGFERVSFIDDPDQVFRNAAGDFVAEGFTVGQTVTISGTAGGAFDLVEVLTGVTSSTLSFASNNFATSSFARISDISITQAPDYTAVIAALAAEITAITGVTAVANAEGVLIAVGAGDDICFENLSSNFSVRELTADNGNAQQVMLDALDDEQQGKIPFFFGVCWDNQHDQEMDVVATVCEANKKQFIGVSTERDVWFDGSSTGHAPSDNDVADRSFVTYIPTRTTCDNKDIAVMGLMYAFNPGAATFANQQVRGVIPDTFTAGELLVLKNRKTIPVVSVAGLTLSLYGNAPGTDAVGLDMSFTRDVEYFHEQAQTELVSFLASQPKVLYTRAGIAACADTLAAVLLRMENEGVFTAGSTTVVAPNLEDVSAATRQSGNLELSWSGVYGTGIKSVNVEGRITFA